MNKIQLSLLVGVIMTGTASAQSTDSFVGQFSAPWSDGTVYSSANGDVDMTLSYADHGHVLNTPTDPTPTLPSGGPINSSTTNSSFYFSPGLYKTDGNGLNTSWVEMNFSSPIDGMNLFLRDAIEYDMNVSVTGGTASYIADPDTSTTTGATVTGNGTSSLNFDNFLGQQTVASPTGHLNGRYTFSGNVTKIRWTFTADADNYVTGEGISNPYDTFNWSVGNPYGNFTVVPEPSSALLLGLAGLVGLVRRKR